jgi:hypothetical protein
MYLIPENKQDPEVFLELNIGKVETKELFEAEEEPVIITQNTISTYESRMQTLESLRMLDIGIGAVVTKRSNYPSTRTMPLYWGIVTNMVGYLHDHVEHNPYMVRWVDKGIVSYHKYHELILVSYAPDEDDLKLISMEPNLKDAEYV